jgi:hypothetical protein
VLENPAEEREAALHNMLKKKKLALKQKKTGGITHNLKCNEVVKAHRVHIFPRAV